MKSSYARRLAGLSSALLLLLPTWSCTSDLVEPDCESELSLVLRGAVDGETLRVQAPVIDGRVLTEKLYVQLPDPLAPEGTWILEFGYNPLLDRLGIVDPLGIANDMQRAPSRTWRVLSKMPDPAADLADQRCEPRTGELCGGLGVYRDKNFNPDHDLAGDAAYTHYLPVKAGEIEFSELSGTRLQARFDLELDFDIVGQGLGTGRLRGCLRGQRESSSSFEGETLR